MSKGWKIALSIIGVLIAFWIAAVAFAAGTWYARRQVTATSSGTIPQNQYWPWMRDRRPGFGRGWKGAPAPRAMPYRSPRWGSAANLPILSVEEAKQAAENYIQNLGLNGLEVTEVMIFDNGGYAIVSETQTGLGAFELLIDPISKIAYPEHGANMMWNQKYGILSHHGMMGRRGAWRWGTPTVPDVSAEMPVSEEQAKETAQKFLDGYLPGAQVEKVTRFYGYYTVDYAKDGQIVGMLSVNGYTSQVLPHVWHGTFIEEWEK
ncbi:MAG: hypothetical protein WHS87_09245 [Anaerolineales bacterium]